MRTVEYFRRMFQIVYLYAARLIKPPKKQLPSAEAFLLLETKTEE